MPGQLVKAMYWMFNRRVYVAHKLLRYSTSEKRMSTKLMSPTTVNAFMQVLMIGIRPRTVHCVWSPVAVQCAALNLQGGVQKTKLLMLREYVNKTEKMGGTWTNTNSYRENEALSDIFSPEIFYVTIVSCLNILWPGTSAGFWLGRQCPVAAWGEENLENSTTKWCILKYIWINMWSAWPFLHLSALIALKI